MIRFVIIRDITNRLINYSNNSFFPYLQVRSLSNVNSMDAIDDLQIQVIERSTVMCILQTNLITAKLEDVTNLIPIHQALEST